MSDPAFRADQWARRYEPHVAPLNRLVDDLGTHDDAGHPPYIAPMYRGINAPALAILRDPGPKAGGVKGSGFLCIENDDQSAARLHGFFTEAGIDPADVTPWNAYPWYINAKPTTAQLTAGVEPLRQLVELLPRLRVVLLLGKDAQAAWPLFSGTHRKLIRERNIETVATFHPSRQALQHPDPAERDRREAHIRSTMRDAAELMAVSR